MTGSAAPDATGGDGWRDALRGYLRPAPAESTPGPDGDVDTARTLLALQFEVRELIPPHAHRYNGPLSTAATSSTGGVRREYRLGVRPVARTTRGWARSGITWTNLPHLVNRLHLDRDQHAWFCEFGALHRALGSGIPRRDPDWIFLDEFANAALWTLLDQIAVLGIALVGSGARSSVRRGVKATLTLDAVRGASSIVVGPRLSIDDTVVDVGHARAIGNHGVYLVDPASLRHIVLAPTGETLDAQQLWILAGDPATTSVPVEDADEFLRDYLPELLERIEVGSSDSSVLLPPPAPPVLVATVIHGPRQTITLDWRWHTGRRSGPSVPLVEVLPAGLLPAEWLSSGGQQLAVPLPMTLRGIDAAEFAVKLLPRLEALPGVRVESQGVAPNYRELTGVPQLTITTVPSERHDWFDLGVTVTVDGRTIPFGPLFKALGKGSRRLLLVDGSYLALTHPALKALADLIDESRSLNEWEPVPSLSRHQLSLWSEFEDLADSAVPAVAWRSLLAEARSDLPRPVDLPRGLRAELRPYQEAGFHWLAFLWRHQLGGILADDMGLGKTLQCLALVQHVAENSMQRKPFLAVVPTSVMGNWISEAQRFTPDLVVRQISTTEAAGTVSIAEIACGADLVVTTYALLRLDFDAHQTVAESDGWAGLLLDEAQFVKNSGSKVHASALDLKVPFKLAISGTPLANSLTDLQALFEIVAPGLFPSAPRFLNEYVRPIERSRPGITRGVGAGTAPEVNAADRSARLARLRRRIRPFLLRRTKELVAADLPAKQEQTLRVDLAPAHRELYDLFLQRERLKLFGLMADLDRNKFIVFRSLTLLRLLALDASLIGDEYAELPSSKLDALCEQLDDLVAEGHRALVFSQFTSYLGKVAGRLDAAGIAYSYLDGASRDRGAVIEGFKTGTAPVFLISLKAGGFGLNLTEADYVFLLDPWWNPASEEQAIDRTHRIGQQKNVMVYRLVARDTIEERVLALQERKARLFDAVIDDDELFGTSLTVDDIRELLA